MGERSTVNGAVADVHGNNFQIHLENRAPGALYVKRPGRASAEYHDRAAFGSSQQINRAWQRSDVEWSWLHWNDYQIGRARDDGGTRANVRC